MTGAREEVDADPSSRRSNLRLCQTKLQHQNSGIALRFVQSSRQHCRGSGLKYCRRLSAFLSFLGKFGTGYVKPNKDQFCVRG
ncbi:hypothetical protein ElyMa_003322500 [Elysia marginata]|uniref:Uncharacterized protein n=1 Tax=Elysia marginata TaxID=1093978 RepID=A0AAV4JD85_9GAST|nr:hypothetical protein ElyMa_003322500 [Elysia marginata]